MIQLLTAWGPAALWAGVLFLLSAQPDLPSAGVFPVNDKVAHFGLYAVLGAALAWGAHRGRRAPGAAVLVTMGALYGASDEWHQSFVPGRDPSVGDWAADVLGTAVGYLAVATFLRRSGAPGPDGSPDARA